MGLQPTRHGSSKTRSFPPNPQPPICFSSLPWRLPGHRQPHTRKPRPSLKLHWIASDLTRAIRDLKSRSKAIPPYLQTFRMPLRAASPEHREDLHAPRLEEGQSPRRSNPEDAGGVFKEAIHTVRAQA